VLFCNNIIENRKKFNRKIKLRKKYLNKNKEIGDIIYIKNNEKAKSSKGYEHWAKNIILKQ